MYRGGERSTSTRKETGWSMTGKEGGPNPAPRGGPQSQETNGSSISPFVLHSCLGIFSSMFCPRSVEIKQNFCSSSQETAGMFLCRRRLGEVRGKEQGAHRLGVPTLLSGGTGRE